MKTYDLFGVLGRPRMGDAANLIACPIPGSNGLYLMREKANPSHLVGTNALTEADLASFNVEKLAAGDPRCAVTPDTMAIKSCPIGGGKYQSTDLLTGNRIGDPVAGNVTDDPLCPGFADRQAPAPTPVPVPAPPPPPPDNGGVIVLIPNPQGPLPVQNVPPPVPPPAPPPAPVAPAPAPASSGISPLAVAGGTAGVGLIALFATGVLKL